ncbi:hypothetical protein KR038_008288 [Drosophila bunnanda]|nr:hypothetical protein KR038_008288 [Drosophila bunnanda]
MGWRTSWLILKLMLLTLATATATANDSPSCQAVVWASNDGKWSVGGTGQVSCACDGSDGDVRDLKLKLSGNTLVTEIANNTVLYTEPSATETVQNEYECWWKGYPLESVKVMVFAVLNVTDLSCRFDVRDKLNCSFTRADGEEFHEVTRYQLGVASGRTSLCTADKSEVGRMHCTLETTGYAYDLPIQTFTLTMISDRVGGMQTQVIELPFDSMYVPKWPSSEPSRRTVAGNQTCLAWENAQELLKRDLEWVVELRPRLPGIPPLNRTLTGGEKTDQRILTFCFPHPPQGFQVFGVRLKCHIKGNNTIWSEYYPEFEITTNATVPARPPQFIPHGFSFDQDNDELTVFWFPLDEIDHNGPNLSYDVFWNGQEASQTYSRSATFTNWDVSQPANITVRSRNNKGASVDSSWLWVPAISDVAKRRASHLRYHHANGSTSFAWDQPEETDLLFGYTIYWCNASDTLGQFCQDGVSTYNISLDDGERQEYTFSSSMALQDIALEPMYSDHVSGGISVRLVAVEKKEIEAFTLRKARILEGIGALLVLGLVIMTAKKLRKMNDIEVDLPYMGEISRLEPKSESKPSPRVGVPRISNPYYDPKTTIVDIELQPLTEVDQEREPQEQGKEESFTEVAAQTEPESSSHVRMDTCNPSPRINLNNGYVMAPPPRINLNSNGHVMESTPRLIPNNEGYINPPPPRLNLSNNGYVMPSPPRIMPNNDEYVNPPPPRLIQRSDGYINPPPPKR